MERWRHLLLGLWLGATAETPVAPVVGAVVITGRWLGWAGLAAAEPGTLDSTSSSERLVLRARLTSLSHESNRRFWGVINWGAADKAVKGDLMTSSHVSSSMSITNGPPSQRPVTLTETAAVVNCSLCIDD